MLSRVANSIYWMARYIERAENLARFVDVTSNILLDHNRAGEQWEPLVRATGDEALFEQRYGQYSSENVRQFLTFDADYSNSILSCVSAARENARTVREAISSEAWETLNEYFLSMKAASQKGIEIANADLYTEVKRHSHLFSGIFDSTMSRDKGWYFANIGRFLERADKTSRILDVKYFTILPNTSDVGTTVDDLLWSAVLRSVSGFEMFRKQKYALTLERIVEFLVLDHRFPRSIHYCVRTAAGSLARVDGPHGSEHSSVQLEVDGILDYMMRATPKGIIDSGLHQYIDALQTKLNSLSQAVNAQYLATRVSVA